MLNLKKTVISLAVLGAASAAGVAQAAPVNFTGATFDMFSTFLYDTDGVAQAGNGTVGHDTTVSGFVDTAAGTWSVASTTTFFGAIWTASGGTLIQTAGTYSLNTTTAAVSSVGSCTVANDGNICFTVGANQIAGLIDFAWTTSSGIRVVDVWDINGDGSLSAALVPGMENGPFQGYNATFRLNAPGLVPVPAAVWLFGSGLLGLVGVARRKKKA